MMMGNFKIFEPVKAAYTGYISYENFQLFFQQKLGESNSLRLCTESGIRTGVIRKPRTESGPIV